MWQRLFGALLLCTLLCFLPGAIQAAWQTDGNPVSTATGSQIGASLIPDGAGGVIIAWSDVRAGNQDIYAQRVNAFGDMLWTLDGVPVCTAPNRQTGQVIAPTGDGGSIIAWADQRIDNYTYDVYVQKLAPDGNPEWTLDGVPVSTAAYDQSSIAIVRDGQGGAIIAWRDRRPGTDNDIYAQRVNSWGKMEWTADGIPVAVTPETQIEVHAIESGTGHAIIAWRDYRDAAGDGEIYAQRLALDGTALWAANGLAVSNGARMMGTVYFALTTDDVNGCIAVWHDQRIPDYGIYAQRVREAGVTAWPTDVPLSLEPYGGSSAPTIVPDGNGGAIGAWSDYRAGDFNIYAQRIDSTGTVQWPANGVAVVDTTGVQAFFASAPDPAGAIVVWRDQRSGDMDIHAQLVNLSGMRQWGSQGTPVCTTTGMQTSLQVAPGLAGGAIAVWQDYRGLDSDIYANAVGSTVTDVAMGTQHLGPVVLLSNAPNPFPTRTALRFSLSRPADVMIEVFDLRGRRVWETQRSAVGVGMHSIPFLARQSDGRRLPDGVYFYRVRSLGQTLTSKMLIIR